MNFLSTTLKVRKLLWATILATALFPLSLLHAQDSSRVQRVLLYDCCGSVYGSAKDSLRQTLSGLASEKGFEITMSQDPDAFSYANLKTFDVVMIAYVTTAMNQLSEQGQADFESYVREGGGIVSIFEVWPVQDWPFLRDSILVLSTGHNGNPRSSLVYVDSQAFSDPELADIFHDFPDSLTLDFNWVPYGGLASTTPRERLASSGATVLLSTDLSPQSDSNHPIVWTREVGNGRAAVNMLGHPSNVYAQQDGYLQKLLWNLMEYVAGGEPVSIQPGVPLQPSVQFRLVGRSLALSLAGEGPHVLKAWNTRGELVQERTFRGSGEFHTLLRGKGVLLLRIQGPGGAYQQRIVVEN